jgi:tRNA(Arg) A34 adenosine deaminase TadA
MKRQLLDLAIRAAIKRPGSRQFLVGAVAIRADGALVHARNEAAALPCPNAHAEARLMKRAGYAPEEVLVVRIARQDGSLVLAKPCTSCASLLKARGARSVYYSTEAGIMRLES